MISVCVPFYPWYRECDRSEEVFNVMIKGLNQVDGVKKLELCLTDAGAEDIWIDRKNPGRTWDQRAFHKRLRAEFKGAVNYSFDPHCIHNPEGGPKRFWLAKAVVKSVERANNENLLIFGIDCYASKDLMTRYQEMVREGKAWVPFSFNVPQGAELKVRETGKGFCWHTAKGIVGIKKTDYKKVGGYEECLDFIQRSTDSNFYNRMKKKIKVVEGREPGLFHVAHNGTNASRFWRLEDIEKE